MSAHHAYAASGRVYRRCRCHWTSAPRHSHGQSLGPNRSASVRWPCQRDVKKWSETGKFDWMLKHLPCETKSKQTGQADPHTHTQPMNSCHWSVPVQQNGARKLQRGWIHCASQVIMMTKVHQCCFRAVNWQRTSPLCSKASQINGLSRWLSVLLLMLHFHPSKVCVCYPPKPGGKSSLHYVVMLFSFDLCSHARPPLWQTKMYWSILQTQRHESRRGSVRLAVCMPLLPIYR